MTPLRRLLADVDSMVDGLAGSLEANPGRFVLGVAGPPGAGKSTTAANIVNRAQRVVSATAAPMDGFHRSNEDLAIAGLLALKGIPETFDAGRFVAHVAQLRNDPPTTVAWPTYDRSTQSTVATGIVITPHHRLVVVEGNYLLLDAAPWSDVRPLLDAVWYLDVPEDVLVPRLLARHGRSRSATAAAEKVASTDLPNTRLVAGTRDRADVVFAE